VIIAAILVLAVGGWLASGLLRPEASSDRAQGSAQPQAMLVEVTDSRAAPVTRHIIAQGNVGAFRTAPARAETEGQVAEILVDVGERVEAGQPIAQLTSEGRESRLREAQALFDQRAADLAAAGTLLERGFTTTARVRELRTQLESAREGVRQLEEEFANTTIAAPFAGVINSVDVETGEFVQVSSEVATLIDNSPLRIDVRVNQQDVARVPPDGDAAVSFATGAVEAGRICFVSAAADPQTRTFRIEVRTANADNAVSSGISAEVSIPTGETLAHFISPAILSLGTDGSLGVKAVNEASEVVFHRVEVVRAQTDGVWVSGLPETVRIITIGQGFVREGEKVRTAEPESSSATAVASVTPEAQDESIAPSSEICGRDPVVGPRAEIDASLTPIDPLGAIHTAGDAR
jgi:multidrug efflux system membrane fusion protein